MVYFFDKKHEYKRHDGLPYESVSRVVDPYKEKFNSDFCSKRRIFKVKHNIIYNNAKKIINYGDPAIIDEMAKHVSPETLSEIYDEAAALAIEWNLKGISSAEDGTKMHYYKEVEDMNNGYKINILDGLKYKVVPRPHTIDYDNMDILDEVLKMKENVCILEGLITDHNHFIAGQEDVIFLKYMGAGHYIGVNLDYKTDEEIEMQSFFNKGFKKMKNPLGSLMDCNYYYYAVKMSIYTVMLETRNIKIKKNIIEHVQDIENSTYLYTPIYREHSKLIIKNHSLSNEIKK